MSHKILVIPKNAPTPSTSEQASPRPTFDDRYADLALCAICLNPLEKARLCPSCSKLFCKRCILEWLRAVDSQRRDCPHCKMELSEGKLVKVIWYGELDSLMRDCIAIKKAEHGIGRGDNCSKHLKVIKLYCCNCERVVCDECVLNDRSHLDHDFRNLETIYISSMGDMQHEFETVRKNIKQVELLLDEVDRSRDHLKKIKHFKLREVEKITNIMVANIESQAKEKDEQIREQKLVLVNKRSQMKKALKNVEWESMNCSMAQFMVKRKGFLEQCETIREYPDKAAENFNVPVDLKTPIPPIFESGFYVLRNYDNYGVTLNKAYSDEITDQFGHVWRVMVWFRPAEDMLGIYLEFLRGSTRWVECDFRLYHTNPGKIVRGKQCHEFDREKGNCKGIDDFITLSAIEEGGYVMKDRSLEIHYNFRPCYPIS